MTTLDKHSFAKLINYITAISDKLHLDPLQIARIDELTTTDIVVVKQFFNTAKKSDVNELLRLLSARRYLDSISAYRKLTGCNFDESKEAIDIFLALTRIQNCDNLPS